MSEKINNSYYQVTLNPLTQTILNIEYKMQPGLEPSDFLDILTRSGLAERRPVSDPFRITKMCNNANLIITASYNEKLIGIARSLSDFTFCTYLSDLAVDKAYQHCGVGKRLIAETQMAAPMATLILLSAPAATGYYPKIGMDKFTECYILKPS